MKKKISIPLSLIVIITLSVLILPLFGEKLPTGETGARADKLALKMTEAVNTEAWREIQIIEWTFAGKRTLIWDKKRNFAKVTWKKGRYNAYFNTKTKRGYVMKDDVLITDNKKSDKLLTKAWKIWVNDSFWLNPISDVFAKGIERRYVTDPELLGNREGLLISYSSGGATPGDSYLWLLDENGLPTAWKMWVSIIPIGGVTTSWEKWIDLGNGALVSSVHQAKLMNITLSDIRAGTSLATLYENDPFQELLATLNATTSR